MTSGTVEDPARAESAPSAKQERPIPALHPILFAAFPVLQLFQANKTDTTWSQVWAPLGLSVASAILLLLLARAFFKPFQRAALLVSALVLLFFSYGPVADLLTKHKIFGLNLGSDAVLLPAWGALLVAAVVITWRARRPTNATKILNAVAVVLVLTALVPLIGHTVSTGRKAAPAPSLGGTSPKAGAAVQKRDIYYIVVEDYGSRRTLDELWNYDLDPFIKELRSLGLYVAEDAVSNYGNTSFSLASALNMEYLQTIFPDPSKASTSRTNALLQKSRAARYLKAQGYKYVHVGMWWEPSRIDSFADVNFSFETLSEFSQTLLEETVAWPIARRLGVGKTLIGRAESTFAGVPYQIRKTIDSRSMFREPTFVFTHIPTPHPPYVFKRDGSFLEPEEQKRIGKKAAFLDQLVYTNKILIDLLKSLLSVPEDQRPIIILQTDEGPDRQLLGLGTKHIALEDAPWSGLKWKFPILNAFYFPGLEKTGLYPSISTVNTFRLVFDKYLGGDFPLLPDRAYISQNWAHKRFHFVDVTRRVRE